MNTKATLYLLTGPWGAGKTTLIPYLKQIVRDCVVFDWDTLLAGLSEATGKDAHTASSTWQGLTTLWADIITAVIEGGRSVVLCGPATPATFEGKLLDMPIRCAYLDCPDEVLAERLSARGETEDNVAEELSFAAQLRRSSYHTISTARRSPEAVAESVADWVRSGL